MSTLPVLLSFMDGFDGIQNKVYDDFLGFYPHRPQKQYHQPLHVSLANGCNGIISQRQQNGVQQHEQGVIGKDGLQVCMDVQQFKPSEISVKTVDNCIVVEGKHEERPDEHGFISRQFSRRYTLPKGYEPSQVISTLSSDGVLTVRAPPPPNADKQNERIIEIQHTGPAHLTVRENPREDKPEEQKPEKTE